MLQQGTARVAGVRTANKGMMLFPTMATMGYLYDQMRKRKTAEENECCGIVGYLGNRPEAGQVCIKGLQILESRGYDSCGIVSIY